MGFWQRDQQPEYTLNPLPTCPTIQDQLKVGHVGYGDRDSQPSLELTQDIGDSAPAEVVPTGIHVGIHVSDLKRLCGVLESERVKFLQPLKGTPGKRLTAWIRDPDGHALELVEVHAG
ncbi:MAG: VOC family protein [Hyphomicrobiales bacterium]